MRNYIFIGKLLQNGITNALLRVYPSATPSSICDKIQIQYFLFGS